MILLKLFISFIQVGLFSVGGGYAAIPLIQNQIVNVRALMSMAEFTDLITIAEMTPGPISINSATFVGTRLAGPLGALICTLGCIIPSFFICLLLAHFYYKYRDFSGVQKVLSALRPAVVALVASAGLSILVLGLFNSDMAVIWMHWKSMTQVNMLIGWQQEFLLTIRKQMLRIVYNYSVKRICLNSK